MATPNFKPTPDDFRPKKMMFLNQYLPRISLFWSLFRQWDLFPMRIMAMAVHHQAICITLISNHIEVQWEVQGLSLENLEIK